jgi:hypothetical protein
MGKTTPATFWRRCKKNSDAHFSLAIFDEFAAKTWEERKTLPRQAAYRKPSQSRADKVSARSHPEATPMISTSPTAQEQRPANLAALYQTLNEIAASTKSPVPKERPVIAQGPVLVIRGK